MWVNLCALNSADQARGFNTCSYQNPVLAPAVYPRRPHTSYMVLASKRSQGRHD